MADLQKLADSVIYGKKNEAKELTARAIGEGKSLDEILDTLRSAMHDVGDKFNTYVFFIPEVLIAARAMKSAMDVLTPLLKREGSEALATVVIGTVAGDLHDLGKNMVRDMLMGAGFQVVDLGVDVRPGRFVEAIIEHHPEVVAMSSLLTTTMPGMRTVIDEIQKAGFRSDIKVIAGGAPVNQTYASHIGADGYAENASKAVDEVKELLNLGSLE